VNAVPQPSPRWAWQQWLQRNWAEIHGIEGDSRIVNLYIYISTVCFLLGVIELFLDLLEGFFFKIILGIVCRLRGVLHRNDGMRSQKWELPNLLRPFLPGSAGAMFLAQP
jgi:hypothetical protein